MIGIIVVKEDVHPPCTCAEPSNRLCEFQEFRLGIEVIEALG
jgi:hypothetical protein